MTDNPAPCTVCRRAGAAVTVGIGRDRLHLFCSLECARVWMRNADLKPSEQDAAIAGGAAAGSYLDRIGKTDLATLTPTEWAAFCGTLFKGACDELARQADDYVPF